MEDIEKEILNRYKLWKEYIKENPNGSDTNESHLLYDDICEGCSGGGCRGCRGDY